MFVHQLEYTNYFFSYWFLYVAHVANSVNLGGS